MNDLLFRGTLADLDPAVADLINLEAERQIRRLIMIPSESTIPYAVREALTSAFHNIYAEGYPDEDTRQMSEEDILDVDARLAHFRRYSDPRYYKGTEFANLIESLARRRVAELYATEKVSADKLFVNVQPLSGAPANSAVYTALINPGDTIMGMDLMHGGHLSHGSPVARSGRQYNAVFYGVHPVTELLDYVQARAVALQHKPKIIIGGYSSYPFAPDWEKLRAIADEVGALLLADIAHVAGLVAAYQFPSPVGIADIVTFTTHKTFGGPRGAVIITHRADLAKKLDRGVFPGEQGGPHVNTIAALAVAAKLAKTSQFRDLQRQTVKNAVKLADSLKSQGLRIVYGGTDTHMLVVDCKVLTGADGTPLSGDMAARLLDLIGITCNRNTLPTDLNALRPTGIRLGTPWITQRGFREPEIERLAEVIAQVLKNTQPFGYDGKGGRADMRAKLDYATYVDAQNKVAQLCHEAGIDYELPVVGKRVTSQGRAHFLTLRNTEPEGGISAIEIRGAEAVQFLHYALTNDVASLNPGDSEPSNILNIDGSVLAQGIIYRLSEDTFQFYVNGNGTKAAHWLQALSDGFVIYDDADVYGKLPGPVSLRLQTDVTAHLDLLKLTPDMGYAPHKEFFVGVHGANYTGPRLEALPSFEDTWHEEVSADLKRTPLTDLHRQLGAKMTPFAGYDMPVWYKNVSSEHAAVRSGAGIFDVTHMGVWEVSGAASERFLNALTTNDVSSLKPGEAHYSYLLSVDGTPLDDIYVYRLEPQRFMIVVNASNDDKDWAWVSAVRDGSALIDAARPGARLLHKPEQITLRNLRDVSSGADCRVDIALQGPKSLDLLLGLDGTDAEKNKLKKLTWSTITRARLGGFDLIVSRTGYTGERVAFELFVHPDSAAALFDTLVKAGATPCGLAARDSLRIEAGLPLYGHELGGDLELTPGDAGFANYVKLWKPFFIGKSPYIAREIMRDAVITRFRLESKGVRPPHAGAALTDKRGRVVGIVTSCSIDAEGYQCGQAYLKEDAAVEGTPLLVVNHATNGSGKESLSFGDKVTVPDSAVVLSKFPARKK